MHPLQGEHIAGYGWWAVDHAYWPYMQQRTFWRFRQVQKPTQPLL
jgi:hypothetical protein